MRTADAVVVGAGVIGAAIALELARGGRSVVVVDKAGGIGHGSTSASSAIVRFHYSTRTAVALAWEARHCWQDWRGHLVHDDPDGLATFVRTGMLVLERDAAASAATPCSDGEASTTPGMTWTRQVKACVDRQAQAGVGPRAG